MRPTICTRRAIRRQPGDPVDAVVLKDEAGLQIDALDPPHPARGQRSSDFVAALGHGRVGLDDDIAVEHRATSGLISTPCGLVDHARRRNLKRGGGVQHVSLEDTAIVGGDRGADLIALDDAMNELAKLDARKVQVVEMRFFGGLSVEETAEVLKVSAITVMRDWSTAKAWLYRELSRETSDG